MRVGALRFYALKRIVALCLWPHWRMAPIAALPASPAITALDTGLFDRFTRTARFLLH